MIISRRLRAAASAALLAASGGDGSGPGGTPRTALLALARFDSFPVPSRNSSHPAALTVQSALDEPGAHLIAALK